LGEMMDQSDRIREVKKGQKIAIAVGSRGIDQLAEVVRTVAAKLQSMGAEPFIVPAMGSHGGATAEGQVKILETYGVTEEKVGAPIRSSMETVSLGSISNGIELHCDRLAFESDGIIVINRIKPHTSFRGEVESGLTKMLVIGLGKHKGATAFHSQGFEAFPDHLPEAAPVFLNKIPVLAGIGMIENAYDKLCELAIVAPQDWVEHEKKLLQKAKAYMPKIPLKEIDVLIIGEMGKNISGAGMDPNIINRAASPAFVSSPSPKIRKIAVLDLTDVSGGNATGIGVADITTRKLVDKINLDYTYANAITSTVIAGARIPMTVSNDRDAIKVAVKTSNAKDNDSVKIAYIKNTLHIGELWVSEGCLTQIIDTIPTEIEDNTGAFVFDEAGNMLGFKE
jgi:hypothetical protein